MLFGGGLVLGIVLKETGASKILGDTIVSYIGVQHWLVMTLVLTAFIVFLTELFSNTATAALMILILSPLRKRWACHLFRLRQSLRVVPLVPLCFQSPPHQTQLCSPQATLNKAKW